jgi:predicted HTH transcriptional regulator
MENKQIIKILSEPEGLNLEFKERASQPNVIAQLLAAFSNSDGGTVLLGVGGKGAVLGVRNLDEAMEKIHRAIDLIRPRPQVETSVEMVDGKAVILVNIQKSEKAPHTVKNLIYQRSGTAVVPIDSNSLYSLITKDSDTLDKVHSKITHLTQIIGDQNKQLIYTQSWRAKLPDLLIGAAIGAIFSLLMQLFL